MSEKNKELKAEFEKMRTMPINMVMMSALGAHLSSYLDKVKPKLKEAFLASRLNDDGEPDMDELTNSEKKLLITIMKVQELDKILEILGETLKEYAGDAGDFSEEMKAALAEMEAS